MGEKMDLKTVRELRRVSLRELAKVINTSHNRLSHYERGRFNTLTVAEKKKIERYLNLNELGILIDWR